MPRDIGIYVEDMLKVSAEPDRSGASGENRYPPHPGKGRPRIVASQSDPRRLGAQCWHRRRLEFGMPQIRLQGPDSFAVEVLEVGADVRVQTLRGPLGFSVGDVVVAGDVEFEPCLEGVDWFFVLVLRGGHALWMEYHLDGHAALIEAVAARFGESREGLQVVGTASAFPRSRVWFPASMRGEPLLDFRRIRRTGLRGLIDRLLAVPAFTFTLCSRVVDCVAKADR